MCSKYDHVKDQNTFSDLVMACFVENDDSEVCNIFILPIIGSILSCFFFCTGPNFYSTLIHTSERPRSVRAILQIVLLTLIWFAGVSEVVESRFFRFTVLFTLTILVVIAQVLLEDERTAMRFLAPMAHCLGCLAGTVFGLYFNRLGINAVSGCLLGIISAALILESVKVMFLMCVALIVLVLTPLFYLALFHYAGWMYPVVMFLCLFASSEEDDMPKSFRTFYFVGNTIGYLILKFTHGTKYGIFWGAVLGMFTGSIGMVIEAIAKKECASAILKISELVSSTLFAAVGWYYFGLIGTVICAFTGFIAGVIVAADARENVTGNLVLCFACRSLGAGLGSLLVLPLFSFLYSLLAEKVIRMFSLSFIQSVWQYTANWGSQNYIVYGAFMWMKENHEGLLGSFGLSLAMTMGVGSGIALGDLCGDAVLMLANSSNDTRVAGWSLMVSGGVVGALMAYSAFGLKVSVPVGAFWGVVLLLLFCYGKVGFTLNLISEGLFSWVIYEDIG